jgi:3-oxoadipate enol-lactonase
VTTALLDTGETDLPPVICLHSLFLDPSSFDGLVAAGKGRFRFVRPTFPGQGTRTDETVGTVTMNDCAADVISSLDELGITRYALIGQSMGGDVAVRIAASRPAAVNALVFVGSSVRAEPDEQREAFTGVVNHMESKPKASGQPHPGGAGDGAAADLGLPGRALPLSQLVRLCKTPS